MPIRFHLDEHIHPAVADGMRRRGIDVTTTVEAGLRTADDASHLEYAIREGRVLVTMDADFLRPGKVDKPHNGIAYCEQGSRSVGQLLEWLVVMHGALASDEMVGHVEFL